MGRIRFTPRSEPAIDWSEIDSRLQEISAGARPTDLPVDPSVALANDLATANDPTLTNDPPVTSDPPVINRRSARGEASASVPSQSATVFNRVRAGSN